MAGAPQGLLFNPVLLTRDELKASSDVSMELEVNRNRRGRSQCGLHFVQLVPPSASCLPVANPVPKLCAEEHATSYTP